MKSHIIANWEEKVIEHLFTAVTFADLHLPNLLNILDMVYGLQSQENLNFSKGKGFIHARFLVIV